MADTSLIIGNGNWAVKENSLLGYNIIQGKYVPIEMNVSRATTGTRVKSGGLIELGPKNLFAQSQTFDNTTNWTPYPTGASTVIPNVLATSAPDGTFTADKLVANAVAGDHWLLQSATISFSLAQLTVSVFAKKAGLSNIQLYNNAGGGGEGDFDLITGQHLGPGTSMQPYPDGWYRCIMTYTISPSVPNFNIHIRLANSSGNVSFTGNGVDGVYLWGAQLELGPTATSYFPTTDRFNIPRVDYSTGTASLLVEPASINKLFESQDISSALWVKSNTPTITTNIALAPDGTTTADGIKADDAATFKYISQTKTVAANSTVTTSVFVKKETSETNFGGFGFIFSGGTTKILRFSVDAVLGIVQPTLGNNLTGTTKVEDYGTYWRISATTTDNGSNTSLQYIYYATLSTNGTNVIQDVGSVRTVWGFQLELAANSTSYIPTTIAEITRAADVISKTGVSSLIGQTEGTLYAEINISTFNYGIFFSISDGTSANRIQMYKFTDNKIYCDRQSATQSATTSISSSALSVGTYKVAFAYESGTSYLYINGAPVGATSPATFTFGSMGKVNIGSRFDDINTFNDRVESATLFQTRLTPQQCIDLTKIT